MIETWWDTFSTGAVDEEWVSYESHELVPEGVPAIGSKVVEPPEDRGDSNGSDSSRRRTRG